ncbi:MAG: ABC transporter ATP-binding protein, partial [Bacteroidota bacterium]
MRPFLELIWLTSPRYTFLSLLLRLIKAAIPTASLFVGKLIIDEIVLLIASSGSTTFLWQMVGLEFA